MSDQLEEKVCRLKIRNKSLNGQLVATKGELDKTKSDFENKSRLLDEVKLDLGQERKDHKLKDSENVRLIKENNELTKIREILQRKLMHADLYKGELMQEVLKLK